MYEQTDPDQLEGGSVAAEAEATAPEVAAEPAVTEPAVTAGDTVDVTVTTLGGTSATSAAGKYTYIPAPTVTALDVTSGPGAGGNTVVITGINLSGATAGLKKGRGRWDRRRGSRLHRDAHLEWDSPA